MEELIRLNKYISDSGALIKTGEVFVAALEMCMIYKTGNKLEFRLHK